MEHFHLGPISEVLLDERSIAHFRTGYRELFGAVTDSDPLYEAVTAGRKFPGRRALARAFLSASLQPVRLCAAMRR